MEGSFPRDSGYLNGGGKMKVAVTGASGYLGRVLLPMLEADEAVENIVAIDKVESPKSRKTIFVKRDVRDPSLSKDLNGCDSLVHLAFIVMPIRSEKETDSINIEGSRNVFYQSAKAGIKKIVHLSSVASYGAWSDNPVPLYEDSPLRPMRSFYYSRTKGAVEFLLDEFERKHPEIKVVRLRPCIFVGPKINNMMLEFVSHKRIPVLKGKCEPLIQFVWDEDVASAIMLALKRNVRGAFNLAGDNALSMDRLAELMGAKTFPIPYALAYVGMKIAWKLRLNKYSHAGWLEVARYPIIVNCDKAKQELGWSPALDSSGAIERFVREYRQQHCPA